MRNAKDKGRGGVDGVEPNIVEITHLCIMHGAHTSIILCYQCNEMLKLPFFLVIEVVNSKL